MIDLYTAPTPNGWKASILLEELGLPYTVHRVDLGRGEQRRPEYLALNPNGRIPTIVDRDNDGFAVFESGAILLYLAERHGRLLPAGARARSVVIQWLMFQMGGIGPMQGQVNVWFRYWDRKIPEVIDRYQHETRRLYEVLERRLDGRDWLCDDYTIADIANFTWVHTHRWSGLSLDGLPRLAAWVERMRARPAVQRGLEVPGSVRTEAFLDAAKSMLQR